MGKNYQKHEERKRRELRMLAEVEGCSVEELLARVDDFNTTSQKNSPESANQKPNQDKIFSAPKQSSEEKNLPPGEWGMKADMAVKTMAEMSHSSPFSHSYSPKPAPFQTQTQAPKVADQNKPRPDYRQRRIDRVSSILVDRYRRITNEATSPLLVDAYKGHVLPEIPDAISASVATQYRSIHGSEVPKADIRRAFDHFGESVAPLETKVFFGRAGYDPVSRRRFIDAVAGQCLTFDAGAMYYQTQVGQPFIRPFKSRDLPQTANIGNHSPFLIGSLFDNSALPSEADLLLISWMILSWMPDRKQVMLELLGAPSSSLEKAHSLIKNVVDPSTESWQNDLPNHVKQFNDIALQHYLLSFSHVAALTPTQQDHLFNLMRGKSVDWKWKGKKVVANITVQCPVMISSLESVVTEPKLADSTLSIEVEESENRHEIPEQFQTIKPSLVAGLLMLFGHVNAQWTMVEYDRRFDHYGGLADLCRVGQLVAGSLGRDKSEFWHQFETNQRGRRQFELEESPVALAVLKMLDDEPSGVIDIPVKKWLFHLKEYCPENTPPEQWPITSKGLSEKFKLVKPLLRDFGVTLASTGQRGPLRYWRAEKAQPASVDE
jgi:hypothetical protein